VDTAEKSHQVTGTKDGTVTGQDREVTPSNPDMDTWQKPKDEADGGQGLAKAY